MESQNRTITILDDQNRAIVIPKGQKMQLSLKKHFFDNCYVLYNNICNNLPSF